MEIKSESYTAFLALRKNSQVFMLMQVIINVNVTAAKDHDVQRAVLKRAHLPLNFHYQFRPYSESFLNIETTSHPLSLRNAVQNKLLSLQAYRNSGEHSDEWRTYCYSNLSLQTRRGKCFKSFQFYKL